MNEFNENEKERMKDFYEIYDLSSGFIQSDGKNLQNDMNNEKKASKQASKQTKRDLIAFLAKFFLHIP